MGGLTSKISDIDWLLSHSHSPLPDGYMIKKKKSRKYVNLASPGRWKDNDITVYLDQVFV